MGTEPGIKGYFIMSHDFSRSMCTQIVAQKSAIEDEGVKAVIEDWDNQKPIVLPPWDPCGALAKL